MKQLFKPTLPASDSAHIWLLVLRVCTAGFMLTHGYPKFLQLMAGGEISFYDFLGMGPTLSLILIVFAEFVCAILIILGLGTRLAAIPLAFTMAVAAFVVHADDPFGKKEFALLYLLLFITIIVFGPGKYSADRYVKK